MACYSYLAYLLFYLCGIYLSGALGFSVELIHRDSPRSPFYFPTETHSQRVANAIRRSINRANHFSQSFYSTNTIKSIVTPSSHDVGAYLMSYSVGTPPFQLFGLVDTGSNFVWLQCKPCEICYNQTSPIFDPSKSTTFKTIPCNSDACHSAKNISNCSADQQNCKYTVRYADRSQSKGDLSLETLTLDSTSGSPIQFDNIMIGCGYNNTVTFQGQGSGIVGIGNGPMSLISQLGSSISGKFSYCLVPLDSNSSSKLNFGDDAQISGDDSVSTPMVPNIFYFLTLEGFSVGDNRIDFGRSLEGFNVPGNIFIDSGSTLTFVPNGLYSKLESAIADVVKLERTEDPLRFLSLCYKASFEKLVKMYDVPVITTHFRGADLHLNAINTFFEIADEVVCFAFKATPSPVSVFGNLAQQNFLVGFDLQKNVVSFKPADCTKH